MFLMMPFQALMLALFTCPVLVTAVVTEASDGCGFEAIPKEPFKFRFRISGNRWFSVDCPFNHIYNIHACGCIPEHAETRSTREPDFPTSFPTTSVTAITTTTEKPTVAPAKNGTECTLMANSLNPLTYYQIGSTGKTLMHCGDGTIFEESPACTCVQWDRVDPGTVSTCYPHVNITVVNGKPKGLGSITRHDVFVEVVNVTNDDVELIFNGRSHIAITSFNNVDYTRGLTIIFNFEEAETAKPTERQVLLSNCDNSTKSHSIEIALEGKYVKFTIDVGENTYFQTNVEFVRGPFFKRVVAVYDGEQFKGYVDGNVGSIPWKGVIQKRSHPLLIGNTGCSGSVGFKGKIRGMEIYRCVPKAFDPFTRSIELP
ncbi:uncharacterized protein [Haliotis asinina]|uniref:uncharacterized protein isoform X1 n=1 Tax=Haliotis asinina TaxID=109174 RepID=UPI0035324FFD